MFKVVEFQAFLEKGSSRTHRMRKGLPPVEGQL